MGEYDGDEARGRESHSAESELSEARATVRKLREQLDAAEKCCGAAESGWRPQPSLLRQRRSEMVAILASDGCEIAKVAEEYWDEYAQRQLRISTYFQTRKGELITAEERVRCACQVLKELDDYIGKDPGW